MSMLSQGTVYLLENDLRNHVAVSQMGSVPGYTPTLSQATMQSLEKDFVASGGKVGAINWAGLFATLWPLLKQYGGPFLLQLIQTLLGMLIPTPAPAPVPTPAPTPAPVTPTPASPPGGGGQDPGITVVP